MSAVSQQVYTTGAVPSELPCRDTLVNCVAVWVRAIYSSLYFIFVKQTYIGIRSIDRISTSFALSFEANLN